jgi:hypothetical protein
MESFLGADQVVDVLGCGINIDLHPVDQPQKNFKYVWLDFCVCDFHAGSMFGRHPENVQKKSCSVFSNLAHFAPLRKSSSQIFDGGLIMPLSI